MSEMRESTERAVEHLIGKCTESDVGADQALKFSHAVANLLNAEVLRVTVIEAAD